MLERQNELGGRDSLGQILRISSFGIFFYPKSPRKPINLPDPMTKLQDDPLWYKDAIIYQLHVKAFYDSNGDGVGDFRGLLEKLDYLQELGVTAIWLLPFYPSPLKDDGYDIADYCSVHPELRDARGFPGIPERGAPARPAGHHGAGDQSYLRPEPVVPAGPAGAGGFAAAGFLRLERQPRPVTQRRASSSRTSSTRTGPTIRLRSNISGTGFIPISRI